MVAFSARQCISYLPSCKAVMHLMCCLRAKFVSYVIYLFYVNQLFGHIHVALGSNWSRHTDHHYQETNQCAFIDYCRAMLRGLTGNIPLAEPMRLRLFSFCGVNCQSKTKYKLHLWGFQFCKTLSLYISISLNMPKFLPHLRS